MKKIKQIGLSQQYIGDRATRALLSQMMALVYIPPFFIRSVFETLVAKCTTPKLKEFSEYMRSTWIESTFITPEMWSVYKKKKKTNNALEGKQNMDTLTNNKFSVLFSFSLSLR